MTDHIESHRLFELAATPAILGQQTEFQHIEKCHACGEAFIRLVDLRKDCSARLWPDPVRQLRG